MLPSQFTNVSYIVKHYQSVYYNSAQKLPIAIVATLVFISWQIELRTRDSKPRDLLSKQASPPSGLTTLCLCAFGCVWAQLLYGADPLLEADTKMLQ